MTVYHSALSQLVERALLRPHRGRGFESLPKTRSRGTVSAHFRRSEARDRRPWDARARAKKTYPLERKHGIPTSQHRTAPRTCGARSALRPDRHLGSGGCDGVTQRHEEFSLRACRAGKAARSGRRRGLTPDKHIEGTLTPSGVHLDSSPRWTVRRGHATQGKFPAVAC